MFDHILFDTISKVFLLVDGMRDTSVLMLTNQNQWIFDGCICRRNKGYDYNLYQLKVWHKVATLMGWWLRRFERPQYSAATYFIDSERMKWKVNLGGWLNVMTECNDNEMTLSILSCALKIRLAHHLNI